MMNHFRLSLSLRIVLTINSLIVSGLVAQAQFDPTPRFGGPSPFESGDYDGGHDRVEDWNMDSGFS